MKNDAFNCPILLLIFNRPDSTQKVFESIKELKPTKLYIAADGPRINRPQESELVNKVREIVSEINWPCTIKKLYRDKNLGCKIAVSSAIDWFFENEEFGIIIEDDVLPHTSFYYFMDAMLLKHYHDERIMMVTGTNYYSEPLSAQPYFYSEHMTIWGWGTWRRSWKHYDVEMKKWDDPVYKEYFNYKYFNTFWSRHYKYTFDSLSMGYMDTWDIQWNFCCLINHGVCLTPSVNLISNIGVFGTHGAGITDSHFMKTYDIDINNVLNYNPTALLVNYAYDAKLHKNKSWKIVLIRDILNIFKKIHLYFFARALYRIIKRIP